MIMCNCWVRRADAETRFCVRRGAHNPECPTFRPTIDPVKAVQDAEERMYRETGIRS
jgi:hypothetical protein